MAILGIGVDVVHVPRIARLVERRSAMRLASRILSEEELMTWQAIAKDGIHRIRFLAVRFSVKEAAYKALYPLARPTWKEFTLRGGQAKKPFLVYQPQTVLAQRPAIGTMHASVSHDGEYVFTTVIVEGRNDNRSWQ